MKRFLVFALLLVLVPSVANGQVAGYETTDVMIEMRDGVHLYTEIYSPTNLTESLPIILTRTPYGVRTSSSSYGDYRLNGAYQELAKDQYIFVFQDMRGKYNSEGTYALLRPITDSDQTNESTDAYDTMDWLISNIPNHNGKIGMTGNSYNSWLAAMALINPHPSLATVNLQGTPSDVYMGDDFFHNGAFRLSPSFGYAVIEHENSGFNFENNDAYSWFLNIGSLAGINEEEGLNNQNPYWNDFMNHHTYDEFWESRSLTEQLQSTSVPTLNVVGWWDDQDFYGSLDVYQQLEKQDSQNQNFLVAGPWYHAGWEDLDDYYKTINLGGSVSTYYLNEIQAPWFRYYLKGVGELDLPESLIYKTGANKWESFDRWPPVDLTESVRWYLNDEFFLTTEIPVNESASSRYVSNPKNPVPYMQEPVPGFWQGGSLGWMADDQSIFTQRDDVLVWRSEPLEEDVEITGNIKVKLFAATSGTDSDWVVKLIDGYPSDYDPEVEDSEFDMDNFQMLIASEVIRAKYRNNLKQPEAVPSNEVVEYEIDLLSKSHSFKKGHRIILHIQSSWFPLIDMNPQKFIDITKASPSDYQSATQTIYHSNNNASYIELPITVKSNH